MFIEFQTTFRAWHWITWWIAIFFSPSCFVLLNWSPFKKKIAAKHLCAKSVSSRAKNKRERELQTNCQNGDKVSQSQMEYIIYIKNWTQCVPALDKMKVIVWDVLLVAQKFPVSDSNFNSCNRHWKCDFHSFCFFFHREKRSNKQTDKTELSLFPRSVLWVMCECGLGI